MSLRLRDVQIDVPPDDHDKAIDFWSTTLGAEPRQVSGPFTPLMGVVGPAGVHVQRLEEGDPRVHLDLECEDREVEVARLVGLGATVQYAGPDHTVLTDPAGSPFCVTEHLLPDDELRSADGDAPHLRVIVIDVASSLTTAIGRFWGAALGVEPEPLPAPFDAYIRLEDVPAHSGVIRFLVQDIGEDAAPRVHLDLHVPDAGARDRHVERLTDAGATLVDRSFPWAVMRGPEGTVFCVVPDRPDES